MIITQTPYRISLFGGSTDYESFYREHGSVIIGGAIDQYCSVVYKHFPEVTKGVHFQVYYSNVEKIKSIQDISNPGVRGTLEYCSTHNPIKNLAVYIQNDLPSQTGIGSSSSLIVGLLNAYYKGQIPKKSLAKKAIQIERYNLKEPGGIQDQIFAAYGGLNKIEIKPDGEFYVKPLSVSLDFIEELREHLILFYTNNTRQSFELAASHDNKEADKYKRHILDIAIDSYDLFERENIECIGKLLEISWNNKKRISPEISNPYIDSLHDSVMKNGGLGCKLIGSGSAGFMLCLVDKNKKQRIIDRIKLPYVDFNFDFEGSKIIFQK